MEEKKKKGISVTELIDKLYVLYMQDPDMEVLVEYDFNHFTGIKDVHFDRLMHVASIVTQSTLK